MHRKNRNLGGGNVADVVWVYDIVRGINSNYELMKIKNTGYSADYKIHNASDVVNIVKTVFSIDIMVEIGIYIVCMDRTGMVLGLFEVSRGTTRNCLQNIRGIVLRALLNNAGNIVAVRKHIGSVVVGKSDIDYYNKLKEACKLVDIKLVDILVVGDDSYCSVAEQG